MFIWADGISRTFFDNGKITVSNETSEQQQVNQLAYFENF